MHHITSWIIPDVMHMPHKMQTVYNYLKYVTVPWVCWLIWIVLNMQLANTSSVQEINQLLQTMSWTEVTRVLTHVTNVRECDSIVIWLNVHRFKDGLHAPGVFDAMKRQLDIFDQLFCYSEQLLTATVMQQLFTPQLSALLGKLEKHFCYLLVY